MYREQTYAYSGIEPCWTRGFYRVGQKIRIFDYFQTLRISATAKNRAIGLQAAYVLFLTVPVPPVETLWNLCPWKSYVDCEWRVCVSSTDALATFIFAVLWRFCSWYPWTDFNIIIITIATETHCLHWSLDWTRQTKIKKGFQFFWCSLAQTPVNFGPKSCFW